MGVVTKGMLIQSLYAIFRENKLIVNRKYQRKLVWSVAEKIYLIDSILKKYPIPLILLAEHRQVDGSQEFEIIDGMQRLNAIFSFIENEFSVPTEDGLPTKDKFFDVKELPRARQLSEDNIFTAMTSNLLSPKECVDFLEYELAVSIYPTNDLDEVTEIFGRINSSGRQLSPHDRRQAGAIDLFSELVRKISCEIRGDVSSDKLNLVKMPEISIGGERSDYKQNRYSLVAEKIFWVKQGILSSQQLRNSEDEQLIADICASILLDFKFAYSREELDDIYEEKNPMHGKILSLLTLKGDDNLKEAIIRIFSVFIDVFDKSEQSFRSIIADVKINSAKTAFYTVFIAFYQLIVQDELSPSDLTGIIKALQKLQKNLKTSRHYTTQEDREKNVDMTKGLIQKYFISKDPPIIRSGASHSLILRNDLTRSKTETAKYEIKQGILRLDRERKEDKSILDKMIQTICGIANCQPNVAGVLYIGIADTLSDAEKILTLDNIKLDELSGRYIVGIDRECKVLGISLDGYLDKLKSAFKNANLSNPIQSMILSGLDIFTYQDKSIVRISIPAQSIISTLDEDVYTREGNSTVKATTIKALALQEQFNKAKN